MQLLFYMFNTRIIIMEEPPTRFSFFPSSSPKSPSVSSRKSPSASNALTSSWIRDLQTVKQCGFPHCSSSSQKSQCPQW